MRIYTSLQANVEVKENQEKTIIKWIIQNAVSRPPINTTATPSSSLKSNHKLSKTNHLPCKRINVKTCLAQMKKQSVRVSMREREGNKQLKTYKLTLTLAKNCVILLPNHM